MQDVSDSRSLKKLADEKLAQVYVSRGTALRDALRKMDEAPRLGLPSGILLVGSPGSPLEGIVTDGDIRRGLINGCSIDDDVDVFMMTNPIVFRDGMDIGSVFTRIPHELETRSRQPNSQVEKLIFVDESNRVTSLFDLIDFWKANDPLSKRVCVVGLGFVGLTLASVLAESGFQVTGIESNPDAHASLMSGVPHFSEIGLAPLLKHLVVDERLRICRSVEEMPTRADVYIIAVGTPIDEGKVPSMSDVEAATRMVGSQLSGRELVILRSTVPVGTCRHLVVPLLEASSGLKAGNDFLLAFAPERTIEGRALEELRTLPQVVGGLNRASTEMATAVFRQVTDTVVAVDSLEEAEFVKLLNNCFRDLSFAFANEFSMVCEHYGINAMRVVRAANEGYPRNKIPLPSPGVGGPCLSKDPYIYGHVAKRIDLGVPLAEAGRLVNEEIPKRISQNLIDQVEYTSQRSIADSVALIIGVAFKGWPETSDYRDSVSLKFIHHFQEAGIGELRVADPVVPVDQLQKLNVPVCSLDDWKSAFTDADLVLFLNNHPSYKSLDLYSAIAVMRQPAIIFDGWGIFDEKEFSNIEGVRLLTLGRTRRSAVR